MASTEKVCFNRRCNTSSSVKWRSGWKLLTGQPANLCDDCGLAYEQSKFCEIYHAEDPGWRTCNSCDKPVHCGCIASLQSYDCLDAGGVECRNCVNSKGINNLQSYQPLQLLGSLKISEQNSFSLGVEGFRQPSSDHDKGLGRHKSWAASNQKGHDDLRCGTSDSSRHSDSYERNRSSEEFDGSAIGRSLNVLNGTTGTPMIESSSLAPDFHGRDAKGEGNQQTGSLDVLSSGALVPSNGDTQDELRFSSIGTFRTRPRQIAPRLAGPRVETSPGEGQVAARTARLPAEGRGRSQLLPRYWPRITDKELQQISGSGDNKGTITPLFEKVLSASDAGRIGRLVLPKACAEAYFPQISQPEGVPMKIQDVTGKVWSFQFRFWPNNNSRMYVLEGVTPCIQKLQLQAGDTVTFSRMEPGGRLVMGYRRAPTSAASLLQDQMATNVGYAAGDGVSDYSQNQVEGNLGHHLNAKQSEAAYKSQKPSKGQEKSADGAMLQQLLMFDWKRSRPLGAKSKRLRIDNEESVQLKSSWEEVQELFRPPPSCTPNIISVEGHEFEEYEEPPILAKKTVFTLQHSKWAGDESLHCNDCDEIHIVEDQWAQCDNCAIWRRVPGDAVVPSRWTCAQNVWHPDRASCSEPQELTNDELEHLLLTTGAEYMRQGVDGAVVQETTAVGLDALADAAALREEAVASGAIPASPSSPVRTTKHPRHRPGCTCIVCIQPPSGKGPKHKPNCICNVCVTVKRRFKTLMLRRKKREIDTHVRKKKAFQYGKECVDGEQRRNGTSKLPFGTADFDRVGPQLLESDGPPSHGTNALEAIGRNIGGRSGGLGSHAFVSSLGNSNKAPSVTLELGSDQSAAAYSRSTNEGDKEASWRVRPSQIDLNMQPDLKPDEIEKPMVDGSEGVYKSFPRVPVILPPVPQEINMKPIHVAPNGKSTQPPLLGSDGLASQGDVSFEKLEHRSSISSQTRGNAEGVTEKKLQCESTSWTSAKGVESGAASQQAGQFTVSSFANSHSMNTES